MSAIELAGLTLAASNPALLPVPLPSYDVECRAGAMDDPGLVTFGVSVQADGKARTANIRGASGVYVVPVETGPLDLRDSIGGRGHVDSFKFDESDYRWALALQIRGQIEDNIIPFVVTRTSPERSRKRYAGQCELTLKGVVQ